MKHRLLLFLSMLFITTYINAQNEITGFLGIKLEDKPYVAIDKLKKRYSNVEWKHPCIYLKNVTFIDTKFDNLVITYKNEKLVEATFTLFDNASVMDNPFKDRATILSEAKSKQNQIINKFTQTFNSLGNALCSKYGNPAVSSEGNAIWRDTNSNSITLNVTLNNSQDELGVHFDGILTVTYRTATTNNDEF